ncbi:MAG: hypothetical protein IPP28_17500 [Xanthomonadales bacterium]|nr:hypothetical protein [Xanthomonadales bacterium]
MVTQLSGTGNGYCAFSMVPVNSVAPIGALSAMSTSKPREAEKSAVVQLVLRTHTTSRGVTGAEQANPPLPPPDPGVKLTPAGRVMRKVIGGVRVAPETLIAVNPTLLMPPLPKVPVPIGSRMTRFMPTISAWALPANRASNVRRTSRIPINRRRMTRSGGWPRVWPSPRTVSAPRIGGRREDR